MQEILPGQFGLVVKAFIKTLFRCLALSFFYPNALRFGHPFSEFAVSIARKCFSRADVEQIVLGLHRKNNRCRFQDDEG